MAKHSNSMFYPSIGVDHSSAIPLYKQLYEQLRQAIVCGTLRKGLRLPSTRSLAEELRVSRNIVVLAFELLFAEGYLETKVGSGTFVTRTLPDEALQVTNCCSGTHKQFRQRPLSERGKRIRTLSATMHRCTGAWTETLATGKKLCTSVIEQSANSLTFAPFRAGMPALDELPMGLWGRLLARHCRRRPKELLIHGDPAGLWELRDAIASYVGVARGVRCHAGQVIIVNGSQQALDLSARVLTDPGDAAIVEDPGYIGARSAFHAQGVRVIPVAVDNEGLSIDGLFTKAKTAKLAYVTPSHQFPLGAVLSLRRRLQLLDWARRNSAWILEDDFDSEFRYESRPIHALQGLDQNGRVIYVGTFSKVLFPSIRLGYMIVPEDLIDVFVVARSVCDRCSPLVEQAVLADFISEGHFASHIRRMRTLYAERKRTMMGSIQEELGGLLEVWDSEAGMHLIGWLPDGISDSQISKEAGVHGLHIVPLSAYAIKQLPRGGLVLGYAGFAVPIIRKGIRDLGMVVRKCSGTLPGSQIKPGATSGAAQRG